MVQAASIDSMPPGVTADTAHLAPRNLGHQAFDGAAGMSEIEQLDLVGAMVEVKSPLARPAVDAATLHPNRVQDLAVALDVAVDPRGMSFAPRWVGALSRVTLTFSRLVTLPGFGRVGGLAAGHMGILSADTWGNEALGHVELAS